MISDHGEASGKKEPVGALRTMVFGRAKGRLTGCSGLIGTKGGGGGGFRASSLLGGAGVLRL